MRRTFVLMFILFFFNTSVIAQDDQLLKDLAWHRYVTSNFTILSIDDDHGLWMKNNLDDIKVWCLTRWGLPDVKFSKECRIFCVPDSAMLNKLFNLNDSKVEIRRKDGLIEITAMWLALDDKPAKILPINLSQIIFAEFEQVNHFKFPIWSIKGMCQLNGLTSDIKVDLSSLSSSKLFDLESILNLQEDQFLKLSLDRQKVFSSQSAALCLLLRKEFGEVRLHSFLKTSHHSGSKVATEKVLGFKAMDDFQKTYVRYVNGLSKDLQERVTPDSYLTIKKAER